MGAEQFTSIATGKDAQDAFQGACKDARYDHGHSGYTGTIAEKSGFVEFALPPGTKASEIEDMASNFDYSADAKARLIDLLGESKAVEMAEVYDSKWGPAVCVKAGDAPNGETIYRFFGWASC